LKSIITRVIAKKKFFFIIFFIVLVSLLIYGFVTKTPNSSPQTISVKGETNHEKSIEVERTTLIGAWLGTWPSKTEKNIESFNQLSNHHSDIIHTYVFTTQDMDDWESFMDYVHEQGAINLLTIMMRNSDNGEYSTVDVNNGRLDAYYTALAIQMKNWQGGSEIWIQPMYEANGYWFGWGIGNSGVNTNESFRMAFQRIVKIFRDNGAYNVKFVYNVNYGNNGEGASFMDAYPGDGYVDFVSIDGYNWGTSQTWSKWYSFRQTFDAAYEALVNGSNKPVIIAEVASAEKGGDKAAWISDMKKQIQSGAYPELIAVIWFNDYDKYQKVDWRIDSSDSSLAAYQR
jgi:Beta-mannanase